MRKILLGVCLSVLIFNPGVLLAQLDVGGQISAGIDDANFGIGGRVTLGVPLNEHDLEIIGSFDIFFPDDDRAGLDRDYWELNGNVVYLVPITNPDIEPYVGAGLNIAHLNTDRPLGGDVSDTDVGLNLLGGAKFKAGRLTPYAEARVEVGGGEQFVLTGGVRINVGHGLASSR